MGRGKKEGWNVTITEIFYLEMGRVEKVFPSPCQHHCVQLWTLLSANQLYIKSLGLVLCGNHLSLQKNLSNKQTKSHSQDEIRKDFICGFK